MFGGSTSATFATPEQYWNNDHAVGTDRNTLFVTGEYAVEISGRMGNWTLNNFASRCVANGWSRVATITEIKLARKWGVLEAGTSDYTVWSGVRVQKRTGYTNIDVFGLDIKKDGTETDTYGNSGGYTVCCRLPY